MMIYESCLQAAGSGSILNVLPSSGGVQRCQGALQGRHAKWAVLALLNSNREIVQHQLLHTCCVVIEAIDCEDNKEREE